VDATGRVCPVVVVVEDNLDNMRLTCDLLRARGFEPVGAQTADQALRLVGELKPDLVLMDISLKGTSGLALTRELKADPTTRTIPIVAVSAYAMAQDEASAKEAGCDGFIAKPINTRTFADQLRSYLRRGTASEATDREEAGP